MDVSVFPVNIYHTACVHGLHIAWGSTFHALFRVYPIVVKREHQTLAISEEHHSKVYEVKNAIAEGYNSSAKYSVGHVTAHVPVLHHEGSRGEEEQCGRWADNQDLDKRNTYISY